MTTTLNGTAHTPKPLAPEVVAANIPPVLRAIPQWVIWRYKDDVDPETGEVSWDKPPYSVQTGGMASTTNPATWSTFDEALTAYRCGGRWDGVGFVLHKKPEQAGPLLVAVDLDKCRDHQTGAIEDWAQAIVDKLNSYTEMSPSGRGLRIFCLGELPVQGRRRGKFEVYDHIRYVTVTGHRLEGLPQDVKNRTAELLEVHRGIFGEIKQGGEAAPQRGTVSLTDQELLEKARSSKGGEKFARLWDGDISAYNSRSEADAALANYLAFWASGNEARIDELFRASGLFRSKWNRDDYRLRTIGLAMRGRTDFYDPDRRHRSNGANGKHHHREIEKPDPADTAAGQEPRSGDLPAGEDDAAELAPKMSGDLRKPNPTDLGNAWRVAERHGTDLRYCHPMRAWYCWDGQRWAADQTGEAMRRVKETAIALGRWVGQQIAELADAGDSAEQKSEKARLARLLAHSLKWEEANRLAASLELLKSEQGISLLPAQMDSDPWLLNVRNGILDLRTGALRSHRREDYLTKLCPVEYDPAATCPLWLAFLGRIMQGKQSLLTYLQRVVGYALTADVREQCLWFLHGEGANGKSTFLLTLRGLVGDYACQAVSELLMAKNTEAHPTERADLIGTRFVATIETEEGKRLAEALVKQLTGGDNLRARKMRQDFIEFPQTWKIFLAANHKPVIRGGDLAIWRRIKLVPFAVTIPEHEKDKELPTKLRGEWPGILRWAVEGCLAWQREGLAEPEEVRAATAQYQAEQDTLAGFLLECCRTFPEARVNATALFEAYRNYSGDTSTTSKAFGQKIERRGFDKQRGHRGYTYYLGLCLQEPDRNDAESGEGDRW